MNELNHNKFDKIWNDVRIEVDNEVQDEVCNKLWSRVYSEVDNEVWNEVFFPIKELIKDSLI